MNHYLMALKNYSAFSGRANRNECWHFYIINVALGVIAYIADNSLGKNVQLSNGLELPFGYILVTFLLFTFIPTLSVAIRRLHDVGRSGWYLLTGLLIPIGTIWLIFLLADDSVPSQNEYNSKPNNIAAA